MLVIGIDANDVVTVNFGDEPFVFDLNDEPPAPLSVVDRTLGETLSSLFSRIKMFTKR